MRSINSRSCSILASCAVMFATAPLCSRDFLAGEGDSLPGASPASYAIRFYQRYIPICDTGIAASNRVVPSTRSKRSMNAVSIKGSSLAADRLVRCHRDAQGAYKKNWGRCSILRRGASLPADSRGSIRRRYGSSNPLVFADIRNPDSAYSSAVSFVRRRPRRARGLLAREFEYQRIAFCANSTSLRFWAGIVSGAMLFSARCNYCGRRRSEHARDKSRIPHGRVGSFQCRQLEESDWILRSFDPDAGYANRTDILLAMGALAGGAWVESADAFSRIAGYASDSLSRQKMLLLAGCAAGRCQEGIPLCSRALDRRAGHGAVLCADATTVFAIIFSVVQLFRSEQYAPGYLLGGFTLVLCRQHHGRQAAGRTIQRLQTSRICRRIVGQVRFCDRVEGAPLRATGQLINGRFREAVFSACSGPVRPAKMRRIIQTL